MAARLLDDEAQRLAALHEHHILDTAPEEHFDDLVRLAAEACGVPIAAVVLIDEERQWFKSIVGLSVTETPRDVSFCAHTILQTELMVVPDTQEDGRFRDNPFVTGDVGVRFYAGVPLVTEEGHAIGSLCVIDTTPRTLTPQQGHTLRLLSRQVARHLKAARRVAEQERLIAHSEGLATDKERLVLETERLNVQRERSEAERLSVESERLRLADIVESSGVAILAATLDGTIVSWNRGAERLYGYAAAEVIGQNAAALVSPDRMTLIPATVTRLRRGEEMDAVELVRRHGDGTEFHTSLSFSPIRDAGGQVVGLSCVAHDITARKQAEQALAESETRLRRLTDATFEGIAVSQDGILMDANPAFAALHGYDAAAEMIGKEVITLVAPDSARQVSQKVSTDDEEPYEATLLRRDGTTFLAELRGRKTLIGGRPGRVTAVRDITERRRQEVALQEHAERLRQSEMSLRAVLESAPLILYAADASGTVTLSEGMGLAAIGLKPGEAVGRSTFEFGGGNPEIEANIARALGGQAISYDAWFGALCLHTEMRPLRGADGLPAGIIGVCLDVTERERSEERFRVLFEHSSDPHFLFDEGGIIDCNLAATVLLQCPDKAQVLALHPAVLSPEFQPDGRRSQEKSIEMDALARAQGFHRFEWTHRKMNGEEFPVEVSLTPVTVGNKPVLLVVWHDLTERNRSEQALRNSHERLSESEARLRLALESGGLGSYDLDQAAVRFLEISDTYKAHFGLTPGAELSPVTVMEMIHPDDRACMLAVVERANAEGRSWQAEHRIIWPDGGIHWSKAHGLPIFDEAGRATRLIGVTQDITERKALEAERERLAEREHAIAAQLQAALQPEPPDHIPGLSVGRFSQAALDEAEVGGDFYDIFPLGNGLYGVVIGDVSGKGLAAAAQLALVRNSLRTTLYLSRRPAEAVTNLNAILIAHDLLVGFVTAWVGLYDVATGQVTYASCAHEPAIVRRTNSTVEALETTGPPLGMVEAVVYEERTVTLSSGDSLLLHTDGLSEAGPTRRDLLGTEGLMRLVGELPTGTSVQSQAEALVTHVKAQADGVFRDDVTVLLACRQ